MIKVYIDCSACGFKGITYEDEDAEIDEDLQDDELEEEECPNCGEYCKEVDDEDLIREIDSQMEDSLKRREERKKDVKPFSLGEDTDGDE